MIIDLTDSTTLEKFRQVFVFLRRILNEKQLRLVLGVFAVFLGPGCHSFLERVSGVSRGRISRGQKEIERNDPIIDSGRVRREGGGRKPKKAQFPAIEEKVKSYIERSSYGSPASIKERIYSAMSLCKMVGNLAKDGIAAAPQTIWRLIQKLGYTKQQNRKSLQAGKPHPDRNEQMETIADVRETALIDGNNPVVSGDAKSKLPLGKYAQKGKEYRKAKDARKTLDHDFVKDKLTPYGIYDILRNIAHVCIGTSKDTAQFAVNALRKWWSEAKDMYPNADRIILLCDGGGSNGYRVRLWKLELAKLSQEIGLPIEVHHYPPGCSKFNPVEHRLFNHISATWAGQILDTIITVLRFIRATTSTKGLKVSASIDWKVYETGIRVSDKEMSSINITRTPSLGQWNYVIDGFKPEEKMAA